MKPWDAVVALDEVIGREIVLQQFPEYTDHPVRKLGEGWDNLCLQFGEEIVFRLPKRQLAAELIQKEAKWLDRVPVLSLPVPRLAHIGESNKAYPYGFIGVTYLSGVPMDVALKERGEFSDNEWLTIAENLGTFLKELHSIAPAKWSEWIGLDDLAKASPERNLSLIHKWAAHLESLDISSDLPIDLRKIAALVETAERLVDELGAGRSEVAVIHGDLYGRHVLMGKNSLVGVIDWGDVRVGDPAVDLSSLYIMLAPQHRQTALAAYGQVREQTLKLAKLRACMYGVTLLSYSLDKGDSAMRESAVRTINHVVDDPERL